MPLRWPKYIPASSFVQIMILTYDDDRIKTKSMGGNIYKY